MFSLYWVFCNWNSVYLILSIHKRNQVKLTLSISRMKFCHLKDFSWISAKLCGHTAVSGVTAVVDIIDVFSVTVFASVTAVGGISANSVVTVVVGVIPITGDPCVTDIPPVAGSLLLHAYVISVLSLQLLLTFCWRAFAVVCVPGVLLLIPFLLLLVLLLDDPNSLTFLQRLCRRRLKLGSSFCTVQFHSYSV